MQRIVQKRINFTWRIDATLLAEARAYGIPISKTLEGALIEAIIDARLREDRPIFMGLKKPPGKLDRK